jgi:hypothetical protein
MGIYFHELCFMRYARKLGPFGEVATLGRQQIHLHTPQLQQLLDSKADALWYGQYGEELLQQHFGATLVESFDASGYEGATHVRDFNVPIVPPRLYDTVIDLGTCEHVFDVAQALRNTASLCAVGGQILHTLPADNLNGHGFWQFSAETFFSFYSEANGFGQTEVIFAEVRNFNSWYRLRQAPNEGHRIEIGSRSPTYILVRTRKTADIVKPQPSSAPVQQSDYENIWSGQGGDAAPAPERQAVPAEKRSGRNPLTTLAKRALALSPALHVRARRLNSDIRDALFVLRSRRSPADRPDLFDELPIAEAIRPGPPLPHATAR